MINKRRGDAKLGNCHETHDARERAREKTIITHEGESPSIPRDTNKRQQTTRAGLHEERRRVEQH